MRVLICPDRMGALSSARAGRARAAGWPGAEVRPVGEAGQGFVEATADGWGGVEQSAVWDGLPVEWATRGGSRALGLDHLRLVTRYQGRDFRLTDVGGNVVKPLLG